MAKPLDAGQIAVNVAVNNLRSHPLMGGVMREVRVYRQSQSNPVPVDGWAVVTSTGILWLHPMRRATPAQWMYVMAHGLLHLAFRHFRVTPRPAMWNAACDCVVARFLCDIKLGEPIHNVTLEQLRAWNEDRYFRDFMETGIPDWTRDLSIAGPKHEGMFVDEKPYFGAPIFVADNRYAKTFAASMLEAVDDALKRASGLSTTELRLNKTPAQLARAWFIDHYPLLGALAAGFELVEESQACHRLDIAVAAISDSERKIYLNPGAALTASELRFVMAHELLHAGLRHTARVGNRDFFLWNVACDFVINGWLIEMQVGVAPDMGLLYDPALKNQSAETVYDLISRDLRLRRKLITLRGDQSPDMLDGPGRHDQTNIPVAATTDFDAFCRRAMLQGLDLHLSQNRGFLPGNLAEEIRALSQPPIPWDVQLAQWFDGFFGPLERTRTYARLSRRQASTPDIPRPRYVADAQLLSGRTFGVVLDSSGSMDAKILGQGLGAIAAYAFSREVPLVRLVYCDAHAYDGGYVAPEAIGNRMRVQGRGGTVLQPAADLLATAQDFPKAAPILVITDGFCEPSLRLNREHAFLMPKSGKLPFAPRGPVFRMG